MVGQYAALALQSNIPVAKDRDDFREAMKYLYNLLNTGVQHSLEFPVKLVAFVEASFQGYRDEFIDQDHREYTRDLAIDIPGPETDVLSEWAVQFKTYIVSSAKARMKEFPDRFFNTAFVIDPRGDVIHKHYKNQVWVKEHSTVPADLYDEWVRIFGDGLDAFFPVAKTPIGNIGTTICMEGSFPEVYRGLAMNGAEIVTRPGYPEPWVTEGMWEVQNRARALDNTMYMICANQGTMLRRLGRDEVGGGCGGNSMIIDYRGKVVASLPYTTEGFLTGII
jgi:predicted amidohydrolase